MPAASLVIVGASALVQISAGRFLPSAWLMPDLLLLGLLLLASRSPAFPMILVGWGAWVAMMGTIRDPIIVGIGYAAAAWVMWWWTHHWEFQRPAIDVMVIGVCEAGLASLWLLAGGHLSLALVGLALMRVLVTVACAPLMRRLIWALVPLP